ncbi:MAG: GAF domain-containing protein [Candidatus Xenobia bacterium]
MMLWKKRLRFLGEALMVFAVMGLIGLWHGHNPTFAGASPHPYLLPVVYMAIRYGWTEGVVTAFIASVLAWGDRDAIFLFLASSMFAGMLSDANRKQINRLRETVAEQGEQTMRLAESHRVLELANQELSERIMGEQVTLATFHRIAQRLAILKLEDLYPAVLDLSAEYIGAEACSLYLFADNRVTLKAAHGIEIPADETERPLGFDLLSRAVAEKRLMTIKDQSTRGHESPLPYLLVAPILEPGGGRALGAVAIHRLPFTKFTSSSAKLLSVIAGWAGEAIHNARAGVRFKALEEDLANTLTPHFFKRRVREEIMRVKRHGANNLSLLVVRVEAPEALAAEARIAEQALSMVLALNLQRTDVIGHYRAHGLSVLLFDFKPEVAAEVRRRLEMEFLTYLPDWVPSLSEMRIHLGFGFLDQDATPEAMIAQAEAAATQWTWRAMPGQASVNTSSTLVKATVFIEAGRLDEAEHMLAEAVERDTLNVELRKALIRVNLLRGTSASFQHAFREYAALKGRTADDAVPESQPA